MKSNKANHQRCSVFNAVMVGEERLEYQKNQERKHIFSLDFLIRYNIGYNSDMIKEQR